MIKQYLIYKAHCLYQSGEIMDMGTFCGLMEVGVDPTGLWQEFAEGYVPEAIEDDEETEADLIAQLKEIY